jgi:hypothetical protein
MRRCPAMSFNPVAILGRISSSGSLASGLRIRVDGSKAVFVSEEDAKDGSVGSWAGFIINTAEEIVRMFIGPLRKALTITITTVTAILTLAHMTTSIPIEVNTPTIPTVINPQ